MSPRGAAPRPRPAGRAVRTACCLAALALLLSGPPPARGDAWVPRVPEPPAERAVEPSGGTGPEPGDRDRRESAEPRQRDLRSTVLLRYECASDIGRREVTLFANGTVRLREGPPEEEEMQLGELDPVALEGFMTRLEGEDLEGLRGDHRNVEGDWIERCVLELPERRAAASTPGGAPWRFSFSRYGALPLPLSRMVRIAEEVGAVAEGDRGPGLPEGYQPVRGDVLERGDGARFRVVNLTGDGKGVELRGLDSPLTIYVPLEELAGEFVDVVASRESGR